MTELQALETLFALQREYRRTADGRLAFLSVSVCRRNKFQLPSWVLAFLDQMASDIIDSNGDAKKIVKSVRLGPQSPSTPESSVFNAMGFIDGDFESIEQDEWMFKRMSELKKQHDKTARRKKVTGKTPAAASRRPSPR
jgi:hypothetical protein